MIKLLEYLMTILNEEQILKVTSILKDNPELFKEEDLNAMIKETNRMELEMSKYDDNEELQHLFGKDYEYWKEQMQKEAIKKLLDDNNISYE